jgi:16S rRNA G527 N7-methylase RsmG
MAIMSPEARFHLVEADQKKWSFLKFAVRECALNSLVHGDRLHRLVPTLPADLRFTLVTSRAVGKPEQWVGLFRDRLTTEGRVALFEGSDSVPAIEGFETDRVVKLSRGSSNYLVILKQRFHVEQHG